MSMAGDEERKSTIEAVRAELTRLPELTTAELEAPMPEHRARVECLTEMHRGTMGDMQPQHGRTSPPLRRTKRRPAPQRPRSWPASR